MIKTRYITLRPRTPRIDKLWDFVELGKVYGPNRYILRIGYIATNIRENRFDSA